MPYGHNQAVDKVFEARSSVDKKALVRRCVKSREEILIVNAYSLIRSEARLWQCGQREKVKFEEVL